MSKDSMQHFVRYKVAYPDVSECQAKLMRIQKQHYDKFNIVYMKLEQARKKYKTQQKNRKNNAICLEKKLNQINQQISATIRKIDGMQNHIQMQNEQKIIRQQSKKTRIVQGKKSVTNLQTTYQSVLVQNKQKLQMLRQKIQHQRQKKQQFHNKKSMLVPVSKDVATKIEQLAKIKTKNNILSNKKEQLNTSYKQLTFGHSKKVQLNRRIQQENESQKQKIYIEGQISINSILSEIQTIIDQKDTDDLENVINQYKQLFKQQALNTISQSSINSYQTRNLRKLKPLPDDRWHKQALQEQSEQLDQKCLKLQTKLIATMQTISLQQQQINNFKERLQKTIEAIRKNQ